MNKDIKRIFYDQGEWIHETMHGYFVYQFPDIRLNMIRLDELARSHFLWGYQVRRGDVVMDVGAGVGEETLMFSREVGESGKVICIEAHPRTFRCLQKSVSYNRLTNVVTANYIIAEPFRDTATIRDSPDYLSNYLLSSTGVPVAATTIDVIHRKLALGRVNFLKMNIEGAERLAIKGMSETLKCTEVLCISCHDFLAAETGNVFFRTKREVEEFLRQNGFQVVERLEPGLPPYLTDQVWGYNEPLLKEANRLWPSEHVI